MRSRFFVRRWCQDVVIARWNQALHGNSVCGTALRQVVPTVKENKRRPSVPRRPNNNTARDGDLGVSQLAQSHAPEASHISLNSNTQKY
ncbi:hypothetical protein An05g02290 [Aspergillus niger]|uniref:Uncharacterized protein n=2 Tax=Aspergillus niger TaxID=5061 RepID=A2QL24_ASPNC|nr:hypothetical protein An05g02290 [Aspergillus niger]CAK44890.1 hypothetical protein An05g02290 [Aspergillus niger]